MGVEIIDLFSFLDTLIKTVVEVVIFAGPLNIGIMILLLKKIEKDNPDRIRW